MSQAQSAEFMALPDLASRRLGGSVVYANDELFAEKENLIKPGPPTFVAGDFGNKGKVYDGWETRRRREAGHEPADHAIVRLGCSGVVRGVVVDTSFFRGNYPPEISVEGLCTDGYPSTSELERMRWHELVGKTAAAGDALNTYPVTDERRWTHARLSIYPDGGVARFRVHGDVVPDPAFLTGTVDLAAMENGGLVIGCSDAFYSSPSNLIMPGLAQVMSDGWENARRRGPGNDYVVVRLAAAGRPRYVEVDTSCFVGNAPGWVKLSAEANADGLGAGRAGVGEDRAGVGAGRAGVGEDRAGLAAGHAGLTWRTVLPRTRVQPDTRHRFALADPGEVTHVRLDVIPDGGLARLRVYGEVTRAGLTALTQRWLETRP